MIYGHLRALEWDIVSTGSLWEMGLKLVALLYVILVYRLICHLQSKFCFQFQGNYIMSGDFLV